MTTATSPHALFPLGRILITPGALDTLTHEEVVLLLLRHWRGDWGDLDTEDKESNAHALRYGYRLLSSYKTSGGEKVWIVTEHDRSSTTVLLPSEY